MRDGGRAAGESGHQGEAHRQALALAATLFAVAMVFVDQTIVSIAAPSIVGELGLTSSGIDASYGEVTGITQTVRNHAGALGMALFGTLLTHVTTNRVAQTLTAKGLPQARVQDAAHGIAEAVIGHPDDRLPTGARPAATVGNRDGKPPVCRKTLPPLVPPDPSPFVQGKAEGYTYGYNQSYAKSAAANKAACAAMNTPQAPKPPAQTQQSMAAAGQAAGETWGRDEGKACVTARTHARLIPQKQPDPLILAYQNGYAVGYDTAYDEAFRQNCLNK
ncbi:hypothetical protein OG311_35650 [Streptomyces sp. NBC_01343]|uniref:hypothetical protein n=1 Tax=Streptomyces sp. NBC_01343 TaxID=2903832 RepID=UPI002E15CE9E|nr:hypothetical protein OG311_35650 [Streptomyces sp. NBC_01343]